MSDMPQRLLERSQKQGIHEIVRAQKLWAGGLWGLAVLVCILGMNLLPPGINLLAIVLGIFIFLIGLAMVRRWPDGPGYHILNLIQRGAGIKRRGGDVASYDEGNTSEDEADADVINRKLKAIPKGKEPINVVLTS